MSEKKQKKHEEQLKKLQYKVEIQQTIPQNQEYALSPAKWHDDHHDEHNDHDWGFEKWPQEERLAKLNSLDLNPFDYYKDINRLLILSFDLFQNLGLIEHFKIPMKTLQNFLMVLFDRYRNVPFHNFLHAFNVAHSLYYFLHVCKAGENFGPLEKLCTLISAFCHGNIKLKKKSKKSNGYFQHFFFCELFRLRH